MLLWGSGRLENLGISPTMGRVAWEPILSDHLIPAARETIDNVVLSLGRLDGLPNLTAADLCDRSLLFAYLAIGDSSVSWRELSIRCADSASDRVSRGWPSGLYGGLSGIGWTVQHVSRILASDADVARDHKETEDFQEDEDPLGDIDSLILQRLEVSDWPGAYDLVGGLVGIGVYFLERLPRKGAIMGIARILAHLERQSQQSAHGITWLSPPELLPERERLACPNGHYNLGVAHGVPGAVFFLSEVLAWGIEVATSKRLLEGAVTWVIGQQRPADSRSRYGYWVAPGGELRDSRLAWCYGDLGIAAILSHIARRTKRQDWWGFAKALLERCLERRPDGVIDAALCHGAAGVAHIFNRAYQRERDTRYKEAANRYYELAISFSKSHATSKLEADSSLLEGNVGLALSLLSAVTTIPPQWDRRLLLSGWPRAEIGRGQNKSNFAREFY